MLSAAHTWSLTAIAAVTGVVLLWVWKRFSNQERIALAKRQTRAQLYAMRLYTDDPALIFRAQRQLLLWTGRYLAGMLRPTSVAIVPLLVLFLQLDNVRWRLGNRLSLPRSSAGARTCARLLRLWKDGAWWSKHRPCAYPTGARSAGVCAPSRAHRAACCCGCAELRSRKLSNAGTGCAFRQPAGTGRRRWTCLARPPLWMSWASASTGPCGFCSSAC